MSAVGVKTVSERLQQLSASSPASSRASGGARVRARVEEEIMTVVWRVFIRTGCYPDWRKKRMTRLIGHLVAAIERHSSQKLSPHPDAIQIKRHGEIS